MINSKWLKAILIEPWLGINRTLTTYALPLFLRPRLKQPAYTPEPKSMLYVAASSLPFHTSGYTTRTHEEIRALQKAGAKVHVLTRPGYPWDRTDRMADPSGETTQVEDVLYLHARAPSKWRPVFTYAMQAAPVIARVARERRVAAILAASNHVNALPALLAARKLGLPFYYELRGLWELTRVARMPEFAESQGYRQGLELEGLVAQQADRVFVISHQLKQYAEENWAIPAERIAVLPNCVDPQRLIPSDPPQFEPNSIGYAGTLISYEGLDILIEAVNMLMKHGQDVRVHIAGNGEARAQLEERVRELGLGEKILFHGMLSPDAARERIRRCALVCLPRKPFTVCKIIPPIKLAEALALGKPVVVPDLPVFHDELGDSRSGWFFRPADAESLADVLAAVLSNEEELLATGRRARAHAVSQRSWQGFMANIIESCNTTKDALM